MVRLEKNLAILFLFASKFAQGNNAGNRFQVHEINRPLDGEFLNCTESFDNLCADCLYLKERIKKQIRLLKSAPASSAKKRIFDTK